MTYADAEKFLLSRELFGWKLGLERMHLFLEKLGNPHRTFSSVHIAGTNGKGSVTAMTAAILQRAGLKVGRYTSPHLLSLRERISSDGRAISGEAVCDFVARFRHVIVALECTFFETMTGLAFHYFAGQRIDVAVVEVGLGGRLDATNVLTPALSVITNLSLDHTEHLGGSMAAIAAEKAGIIKSAVPCIIGVLPPEGRRVVAKRCAGLGSPLIEAQRKVHISGLRFTDKGSCFAARTAMAHYGGLFLPLPGPHQVANARLAIAAVEQLIAAGLCPADPPLKEGLAAVQWPGRFTRLAERPLILLDVAHNAGGMQKLRWMFSRFYPRRRLFLVIGLLKDKAIAEILQALPRNLHTVYAVPAPTHRSLPVAELASALRERGVRTEVCESVEEGIAGARAAAGEKDVICITGSHYVAGRALAGIKHLTI